MYKLECPPEIRFMDLASEVGELGKALLEASDYGKKPCIPNENIAEEIGDVIFSLACIANNLEIDLASAMEAAISKYKIRHEKSGSVGSKA